MSTEKITLEDAQKVMSKAIRRVERIVDEGDDAQAMNAGNCLSGLISRYTKLVETVDLERRIQKLEQQQKMRKVS